MGSFFAFMQQNILKPLRIAEVIMMSGFFVIGLIYATDNFLTAYPEIILSYFSILFYILSVYMLNSYSDYFYDINNPRLKSVGQIGRNVYFYLTIICLVLSLGLGYQINSKVFFLVIISFCLWLAYYLPPLRLKSTVFAGTAIHFIAGILHFHIGYCIVAPVSINSVLVSIYFSLLLCMGHLNHELIDYEADKADNIRNTTVTFGKGRISKIINLLLLFSVIYWVCLYICGILSNIEFSCFFTPSLLFIIYEVYAKTYKNNSFLFQRYYRSIYIAGGVLLLIARIIK